MNTQESTKMTAEKKQKTMAFSPAVKFPVVSKGITFQELPGKIAVYYEFGNCQQGCPGCHSPHLATCDTYMAYQHIISHAQERVMQGANAILLMGGTTNNIPEIYLRHLINALAIIAPVGLYSGRDSEQEDLSLALTTDLTYIKTGSFKAILGGLKSPTTNQRFYRKEYGGTIENHTYGEMHAYMEDVTRDLFPCTS